MSNLENMNESQDLEVSFNHDSDDIFETTAVNSTAEKLEVRFEKMNRKMNFMFNKLMEMMPKKDGTEHSCSQELRPRVDISANSPSDAEDGENHVGQTESMLIPVSRLSGKQTTGDEDRSCSMEEREPRGCDVTIRSEGVANGSALAGGPYASVEKEFSDVRAATNSSVQQESQHSGGTRIEKEFTGDNFLEENKKCDPGVDVWSRVSNNLFQGLVPDKFSGEFEGKAVKFLKDVERMTRLQNFSKKQFIILMNTVLCGRAAEWFMTIQGDIKSPRDFLNKFREQYFSRDLLRGLKFKISHTRQFPGESITEFINKIEELYNQLPDRVPELEIVENILMNLDRESALQLASTDFTTLLPLRSRACKIDALMRYKRDPLKNKASSTSTANAQRESKQMNDTGNAYNSTGGQYRGNNYYGKARQEFYNSNNRWKVAGNRQEEANRSSSQDKSAAANETRRASFFRPTGQPASRGNYRREYRENNRPRPYEPRDVECYVCNEKGHYSYSCPRTNQGNVRTSSGAGAMLPGGEGKQ